MPRLSKKQRWTIYILVIVGFIIGGYYLTYTQQPDDYTPRDAAEDAPYADPDRVDPAGDDPGDDQQPATND